MLATIRSSYILKLSFEHIRNKKKLNIVKYNKSLLSRLNITKEDFDAYIHLKEFNEKYNLNIEDVDIKELCLRNHHLGNEGFECLIKIKFKELKKLDLSRNKISDLTLLENSNFDKLETLNLNYNHISDINVLERINLKELKELNLVNNKISDINVLEKVTFEKLEILNLSNNFVFDSTYEKLGNEISNLNI